MKRRRFLLLAAALATGASAGASTRDNAEADREFARAIGDRVAGEPQNCIDQSRVTGPQIVGDRTLIYRQSGRRLWVSQLPDTCPFLRRDSILIVYVNSGQLCRRDRFQTITPLTSIPSASCFFGVFTPYDKPKPNPG